MQLGNSLPSCISKDVLAIVESGWYWGVMSLEAGKTASRDAKQGGVSLPNL
jgi:hypothetical protein